MGAPTSWTVSDTLLERYRHMTGSPVEHDVRPYFDPLQAIDNIDVQGLTDDALRARAGALTHGLRLPETFAIAREASARLLGLRPFDVQLAAAVAMHQRRLAQLATGEGKTLVAVLPAILHALGGGRVHIFTANDYLARRDCEWMAPLYRFFGLTPAYVAHDVDAAGRKRAYEADVTYVTAKEAGFDFLRDHTALDISAIVHRDHDFAIVDEADFILIDEARVPLVVAGPAPAVAIDYRKTAAVARALQDGVDFDCDEYGRTVVLTERGFDRASAMLGLRLDDPAHHLWLSAMHVALHAQTLLRRDRDYVVRNGVVELVDEWTGRVAENRRWPHGIHPAVEAKEEVALSQEGRVLGSIPMQHFIREYRKPGRHDGYGELVGGRVPPVLRPAHGRVSAAPRLPPHRRRRCHLHAPRGEDRRHRARGAARARARAADPGWHGVACTSPSSWARRCAPPASAAKS